MEIDKLINEGFLRARDIYADTFTDTCTIKIFIKEVVNGLTKTKTEALYTDRKCLLKISYRPFPIRDDIYGQNDTEKVLMLEHQSEPIPNNCDVEVNKDGQIFKFKNSKCINFNTHTLLILREDKEKT